MPAQPINISYTVTGVDFTEQQEKRIYGALMNALSHELIGPGLAAHSKRDVAGQEDDSPAPAPSPSPTPPPVFNIPYHAPIM